MVNILVEATTALPAGAIVTGYAVAKARPVAAAVYPVAPVALARVYEGYGKLRAEAGPLPRKGFGSLIGCAELTFAERSQGHKLWLRLQD